LRWEFRRFCQSTATVFWWFNPSQLAPPVFQALSVAHFLSTTLTDAQQTRPHPQKTPQTNVNKEVMNSKKRNTYRSLAPNSRPASARPPSNEITNRDVLHWISFYAGCYLYEYVVWLMTLT
jgi:hypothetical protein